MNNIIINADDFGMNENCTRAISKCLKEGWITSTTAMVNMPYSENGAKIAIRERLLDHIGFHLNIYGGEPLTTNIKNCPMFCGDDGKFNHRFCLGALQSWKTLDDESRKALVDEENAQIDRYFSLGYVVPHIDSHHHMHTVGNVAEVISTVAHERGFKSMRRPLNMTRRKSLKSKFYYGIWNAMVAHSMRKNGLLLADLMGPFAELDPFIEKGVDGATIELMVHPMYLKNGELNMEGPMSDSGLRPMSEVVEFLEAHRDEFNKISFKQYIEAHR